MLRRWSAVGKNTPLVFEGHCIDHGEVVGRQSRCAGDDMRTVLDSQRRYQ